MCAPPALVPQPVSAASGHACSSLAWRVYMYQRRLYQRMCLAQQQLITICAIIKSIPSSSSITPALISICAGSRATRDCEVFTMMIKSPVPPSFFKSCPSIEVSHRGITDKQTKQTFRSLKNTSQNHDGHSDSRVARWIVEMRSSSIGKAGYKYRVAYNLALREAFHAWINTLKHAARFFVLTAADKSVSSSSHGSKFDNRHKGVPENGFGS